MLVPMPTMTLSPFFSLNQYGVDVFISVNLEEKPQGTLVFNVIFQMERRRPALDPSHLVDTTFPLVFPSGRGGGGWCIPGCGRSNRL